MTEPRRVHWIVPAKDGSASIVTLIDRIAAASAEHEWEWDLTVVDDGSRDDTGTLVQAHTAQARLPVSVLRNESNQGLGFAIRRGLAEVSARAQPDDALITMNADLTHDPADAPNMVQKLAEGYDVVIASRFRSGSAVEGLPLARRILSYVARGLVALVRPVYNVRDYSSGYRVYRAEVIQAGFAEYGDGFVTERGSACMLEIAERLRENAAFVEIPVTLRFQGGKKGSESKIFPTLVAYFNVMRKVASTRKRVVPWATLAIAMSSIVLSSIAQVMLRSGAQDLGGQTALATLSAASGRPIIIAGLAVYSVASALWLGVLSRLELAVAYPLGASGFIVVLLLAAPSGESIPAERWFGVILITIGVLLVGWLGVAPAKRAGAR